MPVLSTLLGPAAGLIMLIAALPALLVLKERPVAVRFSSAGQRFVACIVKLFSIRLISHHSWSALVEYFFNGHELSPSCKQRSVSVTTCQS